MRRMRSVAVALLLFSLAGCAPWTPVHKIDLGMTKAEVIQQVGKPIEVSGVGNEEYFWYVPLNEFWNRYFVRIIDGHVESYGEVKVAKRK